MNLTQLALRFRPLVLSAVFLSMAYGFFSYFALPAREDPEITIREAVITTEFPGLPTERVEALITRTIEEAVRQVPEVKEIRSTSQTGRSIVHVVIWDTYFDLDQIWDEVREQVEEVRHRLPEGTRPPFINDDFGDVAVVTAALTASDFDMGDLFDRAQQIRDQLYLVPGTKRVQILGAQEERIYIEINGGRLAELGVDPEVLIGTLQSQNIISPGGELDTLSRVFVIEPTGNFDTLEDVAQTLVPVADGTVVPLRDVASVKRGFVDPPRRTAYFNGEPAIMIAIVMNPDSSVLDYAARVREQLDALGQNLPVGYQLDIVTYQAEQVANAVYGVTTSLLQTLVIVVAVAMLFLGLRTGLIVGAIVPAVMLATLAVMGLAGMPLERMSLATMIISLGLLVDNGIVVAEDCKRRLEDGEERQQAICRTGGELALPLLASTLTTILVFLPLMLAEHAAGEYTRSISLVILITLSASWLFSLTVTPLLCQSFTRAGSGRDDQQKRLANRLFEFLTGAYRNVLWRILRMRGLFLLLMVALLGLAFWGLQQVPARFFPASDRNQVLVYIDLPAGVTTRATDAAVREAATIVSDKKRFPHLGSHAAYVGFGGPRFVLSLSPVDPADNAAFMVINVDQHENLEASIRALREAFRERLPGVNTRVTDMFLGPTDSSVIEIQVKGPDLDYLYASAAKIEGLLGEIPGMIDIRNNWQGRVSKILVQVDQARARRAGVTSRDIANTLETFFSGRAVTEFREGDDIFPVMVRGDKAERQNLDRLKSLSVRSSRHEQAVPLFQVADFQLRNTWSTLAREDMVRTVSITARNTRMTAEDLVPLLQPKLNQLRESLPFNHRIELDGVVKESAEARSALLANVPLVLCIITLLLVAQFNDFRRPAIILSIVPLMMIGAAMGLLTLQANLGFMVILGFFALAGIIINNAIVLIDRIDTERRESGSDDYEAVVTACVRRLRPILMSAITTILGLLPLIIARDPLFYGMAGVIAFGLGAGTLLTLGVVPVLYTLLFPLNKTPPSPGSHAQP